MKSLTLREKTNYMVCMYDHLWCADYPVILANSLVRLSVVEMYDIVSKCLNHHKRNQFKPWFDQSVKL